MNACSPRTLTRRLQYLSVQFADCSVDIDDVREAVEKEMNGPGSLLARLQSFASENFDVHGFSVPRNLVMP